MSRLACLSLGDEYVKIGLNDKAFVGDYVYIFMECGRKISGEILKITGKGVEIKGYEGMVYMRDIKNFDVGHRGELSKGYFKSLR